MRTLKKGDLSIINKIMGPVLFGLCIWLLPHGVFDTFQSRAAIGTVLWMAYWWITEALDYAVTAFLPIIVNALFNLVDMKDVIANYASETILLLLGASILTVSWEIVGLDKRVACAFLSIVGTSLTTQILFWFLLSTALSTILPNAVVTATITPIAVSMLRYLGIEKVSESEPASIILMSIAWGAGIGGLASPLGGAMNLVVVNYIQELTGQEYMYMDWVIKFAPIMLVLIISNCLYLIWIKPKHEGLEGSKEYFVKVRKEMGKMSKEEISCLTIFVVATVLAFTRNLYASVLPGLKPAYVFIIAAVLSFLLKDSKGEPILRWKPIQGKVYWSLMYIFAGGLAVGTLLTKTGADVCIGNYVSQMGLTGGFVTVLVIITVTIILSDVTSNTATAAVAIPIVISVMNGIGVDPIPYVFVATIGVNLSYIMPTSVRSVPVGYGLKPSYMFKKGLLLTLIVIALMSVSAWFLLQNGWFAL